VTCLTIDWIAVNYSLAIDLASPFNASTGFDYGHLVYRINKTSDIPNLNFVQFWEATGTHFAFGGEVSALNGPNVTAPEGRFYEISHPLGVGNWSDVLGNRSVNWTRPAGGSSTSFRKYDSINGYGLMGYYFGGYTSPRTDQNAQSTTPAYGLWAINASSSIMKTYGPPPLYSATQFGALLYLQAWDILIAFGGRAETGGAAYDLMMQEISIFDLQNGIWYSQRASGDIPSGRDRFCYISTSARPNQTGMVSIHLLDNES
jgi:hypothetical protein